LIKSAMVDNYRALVAARAAVRAAGDPPELMARFGELPTYVPTKVEGGNLVDGAARPITASLDDQVAVSDEYGATSAAKRPYLERLQTRMKERWRSEAAQRYEEIKIAAERWGK